MIEEKCTGFKLCVGLSKTNIKTVSYGLLDMTKIMILPKIKIRDQNKYVVLNYCPICGFSFGDFLKKLKIEAVINNHE